VDVPADFGVNIPYDFTKMDTWEILIILKIVST
jgi:hypothetical protein